MTVLKGETIIAEFKVVCVRNGDNLKTQLIIHCDDVKAESKYKPIYANGRKNDHYGACFDAVEDAILKGNPHGRNYNRKNHNGCICGRDFSTKRGLEVHLYYYEVSEKDGAK